MAIKRMSIQIEEAQLEKIRYIANYEQRSLNRHMVILIKKHIREFEKTQGKIEAPSEITAPFTSAI